VERGVSERRPNILLLMADQLAAGALPAYGNAVVDAPHLARLGDEAVVFDAAYCASPLCTPSRAGLMTGLLPSRTGVYDNGAELASSIPTFAHHLRLAGYRTILAGKMHFVGPDQLHGFEERLTTDVYPASLDWTPDWDLADDERLSWYHDASSVLDARPSAATLQLDYDDEVAFETVRRLRDLAREAGDEPFLLVASFTHPHDPYTLPAEQWARYDDREIDAPAIGPLPEGDLDAHSRRLRRMCELDRHAIDEDAVQAARRGYYAGVSYVDDRVGEVLGALRALGLDDDTIVVVVSDHGDLLGERGLWYKMSFLEPSARVPLLVHAPRRFAPRRVAAPVSLLDLMPTLVELGGGDAAAGGPLDGSSLLPLLDGADDPDRAVAAEYLAEGVRAPAVMLRRGPYKLVHCPGDPDQLFDLAADPYELRNLAGEADAASVLERLQAELRARWDVDRLAEAVRASQRRRHLVAGALGVGRRARWEYEPDRRTATRYVGGERDFWTTLRRARVPAGPGEEART
jgi:choline-sulfatase